MEHGDDAHGAALALVVFEPFGFLFLLSAQAPPHKHSPKASALNPLYARCLQQAGAVHAVQHVCCTSQEPSGPKPLHIRICSQQLASWHRRNIMILFFVVVTLLIRISTISIMMFIIILTANAIITLAMTIDCLRCH